METNYDVTNVRLGVSEIFYDDEHVGHTLGGATVRIGTLAAEKKVDRYGDTVVGYHDMGTTIEVVCNIAEETLAKIAKYFPTGDNTSIADRVSFGRIVGTELTARRLVLDPTDGGEPIVIYRAVPNAGETQEISYTVGDQRVWAVTFKGVPVDGRTDGDNLFRIGGAAS